MLRRIADRIEEETEALARIVTLEQGKPLPLARFEVAPKIFQGAFLNMGQTCAALKRLYVHQSQYDALCDKLAESAREQKVGPGLDEGVTFGPVQNADQLRLVEALVDDARERGARVLTGGTRLEGDGFFYPPTIVADVSNGVRLVDEEQFGPVLSVIPYADVDDALRMANDNPNGLGGGWGTDLERASQLAQRLECGTAWKARNIAVTWSSFASAAERFAKCRAKRSAR